MAAQAQKFCVSSEGAEIPAYPSPRQEKGGGFECEFVEKPPSAVQAECPVCLQILCEPYQVTCCGYSFCKTCIGRIQTGNKHCPTCNKDFSAFPNKGLQRSLYEFRVYCTHKQQGCEWTGELGQLNKHLTSSEIECQLCHELVQHHTIATHKADLCPKRPFSCEYCHNYQSDYVNVIHYHWPVCGFHPVRCPSKCGMFPQRQGVQTHITNECPLTVIDCDFHHVGCDVKLPRKDMPTHLKENLVTHMSLQAVSYGKLQASHTQLQTSYQKILESHNVLQMQNEQNVEKIENLQKEILLLNNAIQGFPCSCTPTPGHVEFTMQDYTHLKNTHDWWYSQPFYTHFHGYKMCLSAYPKGSGDGEDTHVSVFIHLMRGEFDDDLKWPFRGDITIQLVDQERDEEHHSVVISFNDYTPASHAGRVVDRERQKKSWGFHKFVSNDQLKEKYLKNDSLVFRVIKVELRKVYGGLLSYVYPY